VNVRLHASWFLSVSGRRVAVDRAGVNRNLVAT